MVVKPGAKAPMMKPKGQAFKDKSKPADIRLSNINAAKGNFLVNLGINRLMNKLILN